MARPVARRSPADAAGLPEWIRPQLTELVEAAPDGADWLHEIKFDGYRMDARLDHGAVRLLARTGLDWTHKYPAIAAVSSLGAEKAYLDGELCGVRPDGVTTFSMIQQASDARNTAGLVFFLFDLLYLDGEHLGALPLIDRKARLAALLSIASSPLRYSDHQRGQGRARENRGRTLFLERGLHEGLRSIWSFCVNMKAPQSRFAHDPLIPAARSSLLASLRCDCG
jgi:ATP-dependent DNA ligase